MATHDNAGSKIRKIANKLDNTFPEVGDGFNDLGEGLDKIAEKINTLKGMKLYKHTITFTTNGSGLIDAGDVHITVYTAYNVVTPGLSGLYDVLLVRASALKYQGEDYEALQILNGENFERWVIFKTSGTQTPIYLNTVTDFGVITNWVDTVTEL